MSPTAVLRRFPPGMRTDLLCLRLQGSRIELGDDTVVVRSPDRPNYHWGNAIYALTGERDVRRWETEFRAAHPRATWRAVGLPFRHDHPHVWEAAGWEIETTRALVARHEIRLTPLPSGYRVAPLDDDGWDQRLRHELAENEATGRYPNEEHRTFLEGQIRARRDAVRRGVSGWFGAFDSGGRLGGSMGITAVDGVARYASVLTDAGHRRRGIARLLLGVAASWAARQGACEFVIVADDGSDAARLYERAGFTPGPLEFAAYRYPASASDAPPRS